MILEFGKFALVSFVQVTKIDFIKYITPKHSFILKFKLYEILHRLLEADIVPFVHIIRQGQLLSHLGKLSYCVSSLLLVNTIIVVQRKIGQHDPLSISLTTYQLLPALITTSNNILSKRIIHINSNQFPVSLALVDHCENTQHFDLDHSAPLVNGLTNLTNINRIIVTLAVGGWVGVVWILPCLRDCPVVPNIPMVREAVSHVPKLALLDILLDRVQ